MNGTHTNGVNGASHARPLTAGIYAPIPTFFQPDSEDLGELMFISCSVSVFLTFVLDLTSFSSQIVRLVQANVRPLIAGSMGEASHLSHAERKTLIQTARRTLDDAGFQSVPIIAGTGAGSTRETIELCHEAAEAGADYVIVITSGYFAGALTRKALKAHFVEVSKKSPLPVIIYNCAPSSTCRLSFVLTNN
jgi:4-hydroxy-2-oxoglutarate aldolase